jgi:hypothetical protein
MMEKDNFNKAGIREAVRASTMQANAQFKPSHPVEFAQMRAVDLQAELAAWYAGERNEGTGGKDILDALAVIVGGALFNIYGSADEKELIHIIGQFGSEMGTTVLRAKRGDPGVLEGDVVHFAEMRTQ